MSKHFKSIGMCEMKPWKGISVLYDYFPHLELWFYGPFKIISHIPSLAILVNQKPEFLSYMCMYTTQTHGKERTSYSVGI